MKKLFKWLAVGAVLLMAMAVTGCAERTIYKPINVDVPVSEPCAVKVPSHPAWPTLALSKDAGMVARIKALAAENELRKGYERQLAAALGGCTA